MSYVPGFAWDLFFSYAQNDSSEWIRALVESLIQHLQERLGPDVSLWKDEKNIRFGQNWEDEIHDAVRSSAAFLAVVSPSYQRSTWCARERKIFLEHWKAANQLKAGRYYRFLKLVKLPWPDRGHEQFYPELQHVSFFEQGQNAEEIEFVPGTDEFRARVRDASRAIAALLMEMRRSREAVFIATATDDCQAAANDLHEELRAQGYDVRPDGVLDEGYTDEFVKKQIEPAVLSVHPLGANYDSFTEHQIDLAIQLERKLVFWVVPQATAPADSKQQKLIESLELEQKQKGSWALIKSRSARSAIQDILGMLRPRPTAAPAATNGNAARIYLICDPTTGEDTENARRIQAQITQMEKMRVDLPLIGSAATPASHEQLLRECDGLLLYRKAAPERWLLQTLPEVVYAERLFQRPPVRSKAFVLNDPSVLQGFSGVPVIPDSTEFRLSDLEPFLAPLRLRGKSVSN